jgi:GT2 family glycosyltransferase
MKLQRVEVVTPVHNRRAETLRCLKSIERADKTGLDLHIIVVDDGSTDGTAESIRERFPEVELVESDGTLWYTAGTNRGIEAALRHEPDFILAINNDQIFEEKCILYMVDCAMKHQRSVVGALLLNWETPHKIFQVSPRWEFWSGGYRHWHHQTVWTVPKKRWRVDAIVGNCVLYPTRAIRESGLMDEKSLVQYGDAEYTPRMRRRGWRLLIEPRARVFCKPNDMVSGFRKLRVKEQIDRVVFQSTSPYSIWRRIYMNLGGAPNKVLGLLAVPIFFFRLAIGRNIEGAWAAAQKEKPLSETFASAVIDD